MSDTNKITLKWPLIDGVLQKSDTTYLGPTNNRAMYIHEVYTRPDGQNTKVTKGVYSNGYRFIDMLTGDDQFMQGYRPDGSINYTVTSDDIKQDKKGPRQYNKNIPKGYTGMEIRRALNILNPFTWPSRIKASLPKDAPGGTEFPAIVVDKKSQTLRYYDKNGEQQLSSIVSTGANKGDITAKAESKTPEGQFKIGSKSDKVKTGVFGDNLFMGLSGTSNSGYNLVGRGFGIHGDANRPFQLGRCDSHGCVRVENKNLEELYNLVTPGTNVYIRKKGGNMKLIPKGAKGWYATEMQTWSPEKMKQVLEQYGKEGLSEATYAYLSKRVNQPSATKSNSVISNEDIKLLQQSLGFTGKAVDGLYGQDTIKAMKEKYGTSNIHEVLNQIKTQQVNHSTKQNIPYLFDIPTYNSESTDALPSLVAKTGNSTTAQAEEKDKQQQKGVDYRGQNSWTESRFNANKENAINTEYQPPVVAPMKNLPTVPKKNFSTNDMYFTDYKEKPLVTETGMPDYKAIMQQYDDDYDTKYGKGQWYRDANGEIITKKTAPNIGYSSFTIPKEWSDFIHDNQSRTGSLNELLSDNAASSYLFGDDSGFHTGTWLFGSTGRVPMYLSDEESLEDAYAKAYAAGNRRFTYNGKTYTTTSYTKSAKNYLQALYDAEFEKGKDGEISSKTQQRLNEMKAAWANDEMSRFGIDARTLGSESQSGYPTATSYNIANNIGQFGYDHGGRRMMMAANGYLDLGQNNSGEDIQQSKWDKFINTFTLPGVERTTKHATPQRTALMKLGVSQALEDDSPELKKLHINTEIQPLYMSVSPTNYAYTVDRVTAFDPNSEWEQKASGNYTRTGTQVGGTMWNATEVYDPRRNITYIYDMNDYGMGPNSKIGWGGYAGVPVVSRSMKQEKPK